MRLGIKFDVWENRQIYFNILKLATLQSPNLIIWRGSVIELPSIPPIINFAYTVPVMYKYINLLYYVSCI